MDIVEELRVNRESGAKRLESEYKAGLLTLARRFCADEGDAEELVNRTFSIVVDRIDDYIEQSAFFGWMCQIMSNCHHAAVRRRANRTVDSSTDAVEEATDADAAFRIFREVDAGLLRDAVETLPPDLREAVVLRYFSGLSIVQIARFVRIPVGTVKSRLHYARLALAEKLGAARSPGAKLVLLGLLLAAGLAVARGVVSLVRDSHAESAELFDSHAENAESAEARAPVRPAALGSRLDSRAENAEVFDSRAESAEIPDAAGGGLDFSNPSTQPEATMNTRSLLAAAASFSLAAVPPLEAYEARSVLIVGTNVVDGVAVSFDLAFGPGTKTNGLYMAYGDFDGGADPAAWQNLVKIGDLAPDVTALTVAAPAGWGASVVALRYLTGDVEQGPYDYALEYLASSGTQGIDTGRHLFYGETFSLDWRQCTLSGINNEDKGWGTGNPAANNITGGGRRRDNRLKTYIRQGHRNFTPEFPVSALTTNVVYRDTCVASDPISYTMTALDGADAGSVWTLADTLSPNNGTSYDSGSDIFLFRDYNNAHYGKKAIYRATLLDANGDLAFDFIPVCMEGAYCFYDRVSGSFKYNTDTGYFAPGPMAGVRKGEFGAVATTVPVFATALPVLTVRAEISARSDGTATIPYVLSSAGVGAAAADVLYRVGYAPDALGAETVAASAAAPGAGSFALSGLAPGRIVYLSARAESSAGSSEIFGPVAFMTPEAGASGRTIAMTATNRLSGAIVSVVATFSASPETNRLFMAYGAADGGDDPADWDGLRYLGEVDPYAFSQTVAVPAGWGGDVQAMRLFLAAPETRFDRELEWIASTGEQGVDTGRHLLYGETFSLDWRQHSLSGVNNEDKGWGTGNNSNNNVTGGGRRRDNRIKTYINAGHRDFDPAFPVSALATDVKYRDVFVATNPVSYTMTALDGADAGSTWLLAETVALNNGSSYDSGSDIYLFRDYNSPSPGKKAIYRATLLDANGDRAFDFVPVVKDGIPCLFDDVSGTCKFNIGTGDFVAGPDVSELALPPAAYSASAPTLSIAGLPAVVAGDVVPQGDYASVSVGWDVLSTGGAAAVAVSILYGPSADALLSSNLLAAAAGAGTGSGTVAGLAAGHTYYARLVASAGGVSSEPSPLFSFTCAEPAASAGGIGREFTGVSAGGGTATATFGTCAVPTPLYAAWGYGYGGDTTNGWEHVAKVADVASSATSQSFSLPSGWGTTVRFLRFFFVVDGGDFGVEFLDRVIANGSEYVDTGLYPDSTFVARADFQTADVGNDKMIFGERGGAGGVNFVLWLGQTTGTILTPVVCANAAAGRNSGAAVGERMDVVMGAPTGLVANGSVLYAAAQVADWFTTDEPASITLKLMGLQTGDSIEQRKFYGSLYAFQAWQDGTLVQSLVPCRTTDGTGEVALLDTVTWTLFRNAGGGAFGAGTAVSEGLVSRSGLLIARSASEPALGDIAATGAWRGDRVTVSGTLESAGAGDCTVVVETSRLGDFTDAVAWTASGTYDSHDSFTVELYDPDPASPRYVVPGATLWYRVKATDRAGVLDASVPACVAVQGATGVGTPSIETSGSEFDVVVPVAAAGANTTWAWVVYGLGEAAPGTATEKVAIPHDYAGGTFAVHGSTGVSAPTTLNWSLVVSNDCSTAVWVTRTRAASQALVNNVRYTWKEGVETGVWEDASNWDAPDGRFDWPTAESEALFPAATTTTVSIASSLVEVRNLLLDEPDVDVVFAGGKDRMLKCTTLFAVEAAGGRVCVSNLEFEVSDHGFCPGDGRTVVFHDAVVGVYRGAEFGPRGGPDRHLVLSGGTYLRSSGQMAVGGTGSTAVIDDSRVQLYSDNRGLLTSAGHADGGEFVVKGRNARIEMVRYFRSSRNQSRAGTITFVVPENGFAAVPVVQIPLENGLWQLDCPFGDDDASYSSLIRPSTVRVDPDSPALNGRRPLHQPLVAWKAGLSSEKLVFEPIAVKPRSNSFAFAKQFDENDGPYDWQTEWTDGGTLLALGFVHDVLGTIILVR